MSSASSRVKFAAALFVAMFVHASITFAQPATPPKLPPPTLPPPLPNLASDPELEPQVTIIRRETETVEEVRINGELRYLRVTPLTGRSYFLVPDTNGQTYIRYDSLPSGLKVPMWLLFSW